MHCGNPGLDTVIIWVGLVPFYAGPTMVGTDELKKVCLISKIQESFWPTSVSNPDTC